MLQNITHPDSTTVNKYNKCVKDIVEGLHILERLRKFYLWVATYAL